MYKNKKFYNDVWEKTVPKATQSIHGLILLPTDVSRQSLYNNINVHMLYN